MSGARLATLVVGVVGFVLAVFVYSLEVWDWGFRDIQLGMVLTINCGFASLGLMLVYACLNLLPKCQSRLAFLVIGAWIATAFALWLEQP